MKNRGIDEVPEIVAGLDERHSLSAAERQKAIEEASAVVAGMGIDGSGRDGALDLGGRALSYSSVAQGQKGPTKFMPGSFGLAKLRVPLLSQHHDDQPLGVAELIPDGEGLRVEARVADTQAGRDALALVQSGGLSGFSIGFVVGTSEMKNGVRQVDSAKVQEVSLVTFPADPSARVLTAGGRPTPRFLHAADPLERESSSAPTPRRERDRIVAEAQADMERVLHGTTRTPAPVEVAVADEGEENDAFRPAPADDGSLRSWMRQDARSLMRSYERAGLTPAAAAERNRRGFSRGAW